MDVSEVLRKKDAIRENINEIIQEFQDETGVVVKSIDVYNFDAGPVVSGGGVKYKQVNKPNVAAVTIHLSL